MAAWANRVLICFTV